MKITSTDDAFELAEEVARQLPRRWPLEMRMAALDRLEAVVRAELEEALGERQAERFASEIRMLANWRHGQLC